MIPADYLPTLARIESGNRLFVKAKTSSASGLYQFTRTTWKALGGQWGAKLDLAFGGLMPTAKEQTARARELTQGNADHLARHGLDVTAANLYGAHFLGAGPAVHVLTSHDDAELASLLEPQDFKADPFLSGMTVKGFREWLDGKVA